MDDENQNNSRVWKWGIFCYNPNDPDATTYTDTGIRSGKLTLNFAHKLAYVYLIGLIAFFAWIILVPTGIIHF